MRNRNLAVLTAGHLFNDINQGALPALLPFLITAHNLSYESAAGLIFAANITSSVVQPLFGHFSDRISAFWIMPLGLFFAGLGLSLVGIFDNYWFMFIAVALSGLGIAGFHPESARLANYVSGEKKATGVSTFTAGGNIGFALGPVLTIAIIGLWGLAGTLFLALPAGIMALVLYSQQSRLTYNAKSIAAKAISDHHKDEWGAFSRLTLAVSLRSVIMYSLNIFVPLFWIYLLNQTKSAGSTALTILFLVGAVSSLVAGRLADRFGQRTVVRGAFLILVPILPLFFSVRSVTVATILLLPIGIAMFASFSPMVVLGQKYLPNHMGLASGVTLGLALSIGGTVAPLLGRLADHYGLETALTVIGFFPIIAVIAGFLLSTPKSDRPRQGDAPPFSRDQPSISTTYHSKPMNT